MTQRIYHNFDFNLVYITLKLRCGDKNCLWKISQHLFKLNWVVNLCYLMHKWIPPYFFSGSQGIDSRVCTPFSLFKRISAKSTMLFCSNIRDIRFSNIQQTTNSLIAQALSRSLNVFGYNAVLSRSEIRTNHICATFWTTVTGYDLYFRIASYWSIVHEMSKLLIVV